MSPDGDVRVFSEYAGDELDRQELLDRLTGPLQDCDYRVTDMIRMVSLAELMIDTDPELRIGRKISKADYSPRLAQASEDPIPIRNWHGRWCCGVGKKPGKWMFHRTSSCTSAYYTPLPMPGPHPKKSFCGCKASAPKPASATEKKYLMR